MTAVHDDVITATQPRTTLGAALLEALDGPFRDVRATARAEFPADGMLMDPSLTGDDARRWALERLRLLHDSGFGSTGVPSGQDAVSDPLAAVVTFEMLSHGDMSVTIKSGVQFGLFGGAVVNLGTEWHHQTYLPDITSLRLLGGFAMTELGHGSDVSGLETTITYLPDTDEFEVHTPGPSATKAYIGNAAQDGTMMAVFGQLLVNGEGHGVHVVLVPVRDDHGRTLPGVTLGDHGGKGGLIGVDNGTIAFNRVRVARRMLLNRYGGVGDDRTYASPIEDPNRRFFTMVGTLVRGRVCIADGAGIAARRALSIATRYALTRRQFAAPGRPDGVVLMDYLTHQRRLLPHIATAYALGFATNDLIDLLVQVQGGGEVEPDRQRELETRAAGHKALSSWFANAAVQEAREACGGAGYLAENRIVGLRGDIDVFATFEGDNTVLMQLVAKSLLGAHRKEWSGLDRAGLVQAASRQVGEQVVEFTGANLVLQRLADAVRRGPEDTALVDRGWHALMFSERSRHSLESLGRRMRAAMRSDNDQFEAINRLSDHVQFAARAHMESQVLESFVNGLDSVQDRQARDVLETLCSLYALSSISTDRAWFIEHHRISISRAKAIQVQMSDLCRELRPHALSLVDGMGVPEAWLGAAILRES